MFLGPVLHRNDKDADVSFASKFEVAKTKSIEAEDENRDDDDD